MAAIAATPDYPTTVVLVDDDLLFIRLETFCTISAEIEIQGCGTAGGGEDELCGAAPDSSAMTRTPRRRQVCDLLPPSIADDMLRFSAEAGGQLPAAAAIER